MRDAFITELTKQARRNKDIFLLTADMGYSVFEDFASNFPERFINVGIAEANMTGVAAGLALSGKTAFTYSIIPFGVVRCLEQIKMDVCYHNASVKIAGIGAGLTYGILGVTHQAIEDIALLSAYPNMRLLSPCDPCEVSACLELAVKTPGPFYIRMGKNKEPKLNSEVKAACLGGSNILREGDDVAILATGSIMQSALEAADILDKKGISSRVVSMYSLKPLDEKMVMDSAKGRRGVFTLEEHNVLGGLGSRVAEILSESGIKNVIFKRLGINDRFCDIVGSHKYLLQEYGLSGFRVAESITSALNGVSA